MEGCGGGEEEGSCRGLELVAAVVERLGEGEARGGGDGGRAGGRAVVWWCALWWC